MIGIFFSFIVAMILYLNPLPLEGLIGSGYIAIIMFSVAAFFFAAQIAITVFAWAPLQKIEESLTPRVMELFKKDVNLRLTNHFLIFFLFVTFILTIEISLLNQLNKQIALVIWTLLLGITIDLLHRHFKRVMDYLDPFYIVETFARSAHECILSAKEAELCGWIDSLSEASIKSASRHSSSLTFLTIEKLREIAKNYLDVAKGITYHAEEDKSKFGGADHVSYILFYLFQRMELVFDKALKEKLEPTCSKIITILGKIAIYGAKYDITLAAYPLYYLGKLTEKAQHKNLQDVGNRATATLLEVAKVIVKDVDLRYVEIKEAFLTLTNTMHSVAKNTFRNDKSINIRILSQPFYELMELFKSEKIADHQDTPSILNNIELVLNEFSTLETVMSTLPPISELTKERKAAEEETREEIPKKEVEEEKE
jgi:hypothetical protein